MIRIFPSLFFLCLFILSISAQTDPGLLSLDRIYSGEFRTDNLGPFQWFENGNAYTKLERSASGRGQDLMRYDSRTGAASLILASVQLIPQGKTQPLSRRLHAYCWRQKRVG